MSGQGFTQAHRQGPGEDDEAQSPLAGQVSAGKQDHGVDDMLDEIDSVLESNSAEFVSSFVQKGGQ